MDVEDKVARGDVEELVGREGFSFADIVEETSVAFIDDADVIL